MRSDERASQNLVIECHVAGRKLEAVNAGSAPIGDELDALGMQGELSDQVTQRCVDGFEHATAEGMLPHLFEPVADHLRATLPA